MKKPLAKAETKLQSLIEGSLARMLGGKVSPALIASQLANGMIDGLIWDNGGKAFAPDQYAITMHPKDVQVVIEEAPDLQADLAQALLDTARAEGYSMANEPNVTLAADPTLKPLDIRVIAWHSRIQLEFTQAEEVHVPTGSNGCPRGAYLILHGQRHFQLDRPLVNVGRRLDNQLILDDPHVSRTHAQIRAREGRYVVFDLGSTGGTIVNGHRIHQHVLRPGDVITIAGTSMVYGEDPGGPPDATPAYSPPFPPKPAGDQLTRTWDKAGKNEA
jgi:hypothetical protein